MLGNLAVDNQKQISILDEKRVADLQEKCMTTKLTNLLDHPVSGRCYTCSLT